MAAKTSISWTHRTWNPIAARLKSSGQRGWYCEKVSQGCKHCYAEKMNLRLGTKTPFDVRFRDQVELELVNLLEPLRWKKPQMIFVNSMTDLFLETIPDEWIDRIFAVMALAPHHTFQILTKRPERMGAYLLRLADDDPADRLSDAIGDEVSDEYVCHIANVLNGQAWWKQMPERGVPLDGSSPLWPLPNAWLGVSIEDQAAADERIPLLLQTPATVRWISAEPLLGPVDLGHVITSKPKTIETGFGLAVYSQWIDALTGEFCSNGIGGVLSRPCSRLGWVVVGGESGPGARPFDLSWARSIVDRCRRAQVPVFVKQLGRCPFIGPEHDGATGYDLRLIDRKGEDWNEWPEDLRVREFPLGNRIDS